MYGTMSTEVLERRQEELLSEAQLNSLENALQGNRKRPDTSRWASTVAWKLARATGLLQKLFEKYAG